VDDRWGMKPLVKLSAQILLAMGAYALNIRIQNVMGLNLPEWVNFCGTVIWFLAIMNSINLIDGIDGLATGIALIAATGVGISLIFRKSPGDVLLFAGFAGACLGFLRYNFYPASVFLGDTGSLFLGLTLASLTISTSSKGSAIAVIGMPLLAVGVPLFDSVLAVWRRSIRRMLAGGDDEGARVSIDQADSDHLHHRLLRKFHKHSQVALVLYAVTALLALLGILTTVFHDRALGIFGIAFVVAAYTIFRHLAWIELRDTGEVVLRGIAKPARRNLSLIIYILIDLLILNAAWFASASLIELQNCTIDISLKSAWLRAVPVDIIIPFLFLLGLRAYSRAWSLAGVVEYVAIGFAGTLGCLTATAVSLLYVNPNSNAWAVILQKITLFGLALPLILGARVSLRAVQGLMNRSWGALMQEKAGVPRVIIGGDGPDLVLFFRRRAMDLGHASDLVIRGIVTTDEALRGHYINGSRVLGTMSDLPALLHSTECTQVIWVGELTSEEVAKLRPSLTHEGVRLIQWSIVENDVDLLASDVK
jgi:UDP-GlcNAc:undecaprenyl-phosphate/decaprenyl-phosphate GlcNAc-1-phosphate transferase